MGYAGNTSLLSEWLEICSGSGSSKLSGKTHRKPVHCARDFCMARFWSFLGTALFQGLTLAANMLGARLLGKERYGEFGIILNTVGMFGMFAGAGLGMTATKYLAEFRDTDKPRAGRILGLCLKMTWCFGAVISLLLFFAAPYLAATTLNDPHLTLVTPLRFGIGILFFNALCGVQNSALSGLEAFTTLTRLNIYDLLCAGHRHIESSVHDSCPLSCD